MGPSEHALQQIFDHAAVGIAQIGLDGTFLRVNDRYCRMLGYSEAELLSKTLRDINPSDNRAEVLEGCRQLQDGLIASHSVDKRYVRKDGTVFWGRLHRSLVRNRHNEPQYFVAVVEDITEKVQAERALQDSEQRLALAASASRLGLWDSDLRSGITMTSGEYAGLHGLKSEHARLTHEEWLATVHPDDRERLQALLRESLETTRVWEAEFRIVRPDGSVRWLFGKGQVYLDDSGRPARMAGVSLDITDRKRIEEQRARLASIVESSEDAIISKNLDGVVVSWNAGAEKIFGYSAAEIIGQPCSRLLPLERLHEFPRILESTRSGARLENYEVSVLSKDGRRVEVAVTISPIRDSAGTLVGNSAIARDITERKQAAAALQETQQRYKEVFDTTSECIFLIDVTPDARFKIASLNPAAESVVGHSSREASGKFVEESTSPQVAASVIARYRRCLEAGAPINYEEDLLLPVGHRYFQTNLIPVRDSQGRIHRIVGIARDITRYRQAEEALRLSQQRLEMAQEAGGIGTWDWNIRSDQVHCSKEYNRLFGRPESELEGPHEAWLGAIHPQDRGRVQEELSRALDGGPGYKAEYRVVWPDGTVLWLFGKGEVFRDPSGRPLRMLGVTMDISERKYAEQALRESEERFRTMADTAPVMIWISGADKRCIFFNAAWLAFTGRTMEQECGNGWTEGVHPADLDRCLAEYYSAFDARRGFHMEYRLRRKDGEYRSILHNGVPRFEPGGAFAGYIGSAIDISNVKRAEQELELNQALRESEAKYHRIVETMTEGVWILDRDRRTIFVNRQMAAMLGYTVEEMLGRDVLDFKDEEARPIALQKLERRGQGITEQYDSTFQTRDGRRLTVLISTRPLLDSDGRYSGSLGIITDITERTVLEGQLHQARKMEAIGRLAGGVAHDFNNLLTVISGYTDLLLRNLSPGDRFHTELAEIRGAGQRAQELTAQMLAFSRGQVRETEVLSLHTVIQDVEQMLRRMIGEDIEVFTAAEPGLGLIQADRTELIQILLNLAVNARDAMPAGGTLTFQTQNVEVPPTDTRNHVGPRAGAYVLLTVADTGVGMDTEIQRHLFEPFFTTKQPGKGTGLGLATVYGIVSQRGGWIQVESKPHQGTTFRIYWPRVEATPSAEVRHSELPKPPSDGTGTVLVVEDQSQVRQITCAILKEFGYRILEASDGEEALRLAEAHQGPLHLLLTDVIMPGMNGLELAARVRKIRPIPILFMSGYSDRMKALHDSGAAYIQKPFTPDALAGKVREIIGDTNGNSGRGSRLET